MDKLIEEAKQIIKDNIYATLGTCGRNQLPWVSPLFISYDRQLNFIGYLQKTVFIQKT